MCACVSMNVYVTSCAVIKGFEEAIPEGQAFSVLVRPSPTKSSPTICKKKKKLCMLVRHPSVVINIHNTSTKDNIGALPY